jgi:hypothetical protein
MKRLLIVIALLSVLLAGCDDLTTPCQYAVIHISDTAGNFTDYRIEDYHAVEEGIKVKLQDGNYVFCSEGNYILAEDYCPICGRK